VSEVAGRGSPARGPGGNAVRSLVVAVAERALFLCRAASRSRLLAVLWNALTACALFCCRAVHRAAATRSGHSCRDRPRARAFPPGPRAGAAAPCDLAHARSRSTAARRRAPAAGGRRASPRRGADAVPRARFRRARATAVRAAEAGPRARGSADSDHRDRRSAPRPLAIFVNVQEGQSFKVSADAARVAQAITAMLDEAARRAMRTCVSSRAARDGVRGRRLGRSGEKRHHAAAGEG